MIGATQRKAGQVIPLTRPLVLAPATLVCLDIETGHASDRVIENEIENWTPPSNMKDEKKIEEKRLEFRAKTKDKSALLDGSPVVCISARTEKVGRIFNGIDKKPYKVNHSEVISGGSEQQMLLDFRTWLDSVTDEKTILIGFNIYGFDLPRLRAAFMRNRLRLPIILAPRILDDQKQPTVDVMKMFLYGFTAEYGNEKYIRLDEVIQKLDLPRYKDRINGALVPEFVRQGKIKEVLTYCAVDTMATLQAYHLMTSTSSDMQ